MTEIVVDRTTIEMSFILLILIQSIFVVYSCSKHKTIASILFLYVLGTIFGLLSAFLFLSLIGQGGLT